MIWYGNHTAAKVKSRKTPHLLKAVVMQHSPEEHEGASEQNDAQVTDFLERKHFPQKWGVGPNKAVSE